MASIQFVQLSLPMYSYPIQPAKIKILILIWERSRPRLAHLLVPPAGRLGVARRREGLRAEDPIAGQVRCRLHMRGWPRDRELLALPLLPLPHGAAAPSGFEDGVRRLLYKLIFRYYMHIYVNVNMCEYIYI